MRARIGIALAGALAFVAADEARAQNAVVVGVPLPNGNPAYVPAPHAPAYQRVYAYKDEPVMSINRSYLGYSNFVSDAPTLPPGGYPSGYRMVPAPGYYVNGGYPPARRPFGLFGWRRYPR